MAELDIEALTPLHLTNCDLNSATRLPVCDCQMPAIIAALEDRKRLREAAQEVWDSVPASYEPDDPMVKRHAAALIALGAALEGRDG